MLAFFVSALRWFGGESKGCQAEVSPLLWRPLLRRRLLARMTIQASSSIGRAAVSKTAGWGFDSLLACQILVWPNRNGSLCKVNIFEFK